MTKSRLYLVLLSESQSLQEQKNDVVPAPWSHSLKGKLIGNMRGAIESQRRSLLVYLRNTQEKLFKKMMIRQLSFKDYVTVLPGRGRKNTLYRKRAIHMHISQLLVFLRNRSTRSMEPEQWQSGDRLLQTKWNGILKSILKDLNFTAQKMRKY